jgi:hypothetical protein
MYQPLFAQEQLIDRQSFEVEVGLATSVSIRIAIICAYKLMEGYSQMVNNSIIPSNFKQVRK